MGIQPPVDIPGGIMLTSFDRHNLWVLDLDRNRRYPLPDTRPCGTNCQISPDHQWITYYHPADQTFMKMRMDGTERTIIAEDVTDVGWWRQDTFVLWTAGQRVSLLHDGALETLNTYGAISLQPDGKWTLKIDYQDGQFVRVLHHLDTGEAILLAPEAPFFNGNAWSQNGRWFAYVAVGDRGGEVFGIEPDRQNSATQWTAFAVRDGGVRIGGQTPLAGLRWSPDHQKLAFWVMPLLGDDPLIDVGPAMIHVYDVDTQTVTAYCGFTTEDHSPNPARLIWSPDSTHLAFGDNPENDTRGTLLLVLNIETGIYMEVSQHIYPALGRADVIAWGVR
jgi:Tol biopolymer transport system component